MFNSDQRQQKKNVEVQVDLDDGKQIVGKLALSQDQRVSDLLNDDRLFLPLKTSGGIVVILRKMVINKVVPLDQQIEQDKVSDPYKILGVSQNLSDEKLKEVYHELCSKNHPDKVQSSGLSDQFLELANSRMLRINDAYERILAMRRAETANDQQSNSEPDPFDKAANTKS